MFPLAYTRAVALAGAQAMEHNTGCFVKSRGLRKPVRYGNAVCRSHSSRWSRSSPAPGGTGLGGFIGALFKSESNRTISLLLAFAGGVMTAMVCFDLLAEAEEAASQIAEHGVVLVIFAVALGVAVVYLLNHLIDRKTRKEVSHTAMSIIPRPMTTSTNWCTPTT